MRQRRVAFLASLGSALEYYDFVIYGMMAKYLSKVFFPNSDSITGLVQAFAIFAIGYFARPLGGIVNGMIADRLGRKNIFLAVTVLMAFATLGIGLLPGYQQWGIGASCLLVSLRILQGFSFGAELPGAVTLVMENGEKKGSLFSSFVISSATLGSIFATVLLYLLTHFLTEAQILSWGWRIPFLVGGGIAVISYMIRKELQETPAFVSELGKNGNKNFLDPLVQLLAHHGKQVILGIGLALFASSLVIVNLYFPSYLNKYYSYEPSAIYFAMTLSLVWSVVVLPLFGIVANKYGEKKVFSLAAASFIVLAIPLFKILALKNAAALIFFMLLYQTFLAAAMSSFFPLMSRLLPTSVRYTGLAACYNIAFSLSACVPAILTYLLNLIGHADVLVGYLIAVGGVSSLCCLNYRLELKRYP